MTKIKKGDVFPTNYCGDVEVTELCNDGYVMVKFLVVGEVRKVRKNHLSSGLATEIGAAKVMLKRASLIGNNNEFTPDSPKAQYEAAKKIWRNNKDEL